MEASIAQRFKNSISEWMHSPENRGKFSAKMRARVIVDEAGSKVLAGKG